MTLEPMTEQVRALYGLTTDQLRDLIAAEREAGRAWGATAEAARILYELRTGRKL